MGLGRTLDHYSLRARVNLLGEVNALPHNSVQPLGHTNVPQPAVDKASVYAPRWG